MDVELRNIRGIKSLNFEIPEKGLWLVTGSNGSGKSSLFTALHRIGFANAFQWQYKAASDKIDTYKHATIIYKVNGKEVAYSYGGQKWRATPKREYNLIYNGPFKSVISIGADSNRIEPHAKDITSPGRSKECSAEVTSFLKEVLEDNKWDNLRYVHTTRGQCNKAHIIPAIGTTYYSEKNFSLGELCLLKMANQLFDIESNSLVLIDEVEMALHPKAQIRLYQQLEKISAASKLTILLSTHSPSLIKHSPHNRIIYLANNNGHVCVEQNVFPARILGELACDEENCYDLLFYVEDNEAKTLLNRVLEKYITMHPQKNRRYRIIPIGGYDAVIRMLKESNYFLPCYVNRFSVVDNDVLTNDNLTSFNKHKSDLHPTLQGKVAILPCTPEVGLMEAILANKISSFSHCGATATIQNQTSTKEFQELHGKNYRKIAKLQLDSIKKYLEEKTGAIDFKISENLYDQYIDQCLTVSDLCKFAGPFFS